MSKFSDRLKGTVGQVTSPITNAEAQQIKKKSAPTAPGSTNNLREMMVEMLPGQIEIAKIVEVEGRKRSLTPQQFKDLKGNIEQNGLIHKIVVRAIKGDRYEVIAGHNRLEAYRQLGKTKIEADIQEIEPGRAVIENAFYSNLFQSELTAFEKYQGFKEIREITDETQEQMARKAGISRQQVTSLFAFEEFPESAQNILKNHPEILGYTAAGELKKLGETKLLNILNKLVLGEITETKAVEMAVEKPKPVGEKIEPIVIRKGKTTYASIKPKGRLIAITLGKDVEAEAVLKQIQELLKSNIQ